MDFLLLLSEWWWTVPVAVGGATAGVIGVRRHGAKRGRRLAYEAARLDLRRAKHTVAEQRMAARVARAEFARVSAERRAQRATPAQVAGAKRILRGRENDLRAASAEVRVKRVRLSAARAAIPTGAAPHPLESLQRAHEAVTARWMRYETDVSLQISYPVMTDVKQEATAAYLRAAARAAEARRAAVDSAQPVAFAAYRDAVAELEAAFDSAEHAARVQAGEQPAAGWQEAAQDMISRSTEAIDRAAGAVASAFTAWAARKRTDRDERRGRAR